MPLSLGMVLSRHEHDYSALMNMILELYLQAVVLG